MSALQQVRMRKLAGVTPLSSSGLHERDTEGNRGMAHKRKQQDKDTQRNCGRPKLRLPCETLTVFNSVRYVSGVGLSPSFGTVVSTVKVSSIASRLILDWAAIQQNE